MTLDADRQPCYTDGMMTTATCPECEREFDLLDEDDAGEWFYGHDCEAPEVVLPLDREPNVYRNGSGGLTCGDCGDLLILFDLDEHFCPATGTSTDLYSDEERQAYYDEMGDE